MRLPEGLSFAERRFLRDLDSLKLAEERARMPRIAHKLVRPIYGVEGLFNHWRHAVEVIEQQRTYMKPEFLCDLECRDRLEVLITQVPPELSEKLRAWVQDIDDRYRRVSTWDDGEEFRVRDEVNPGWWWLRRPDPFPPGW